MNEIGKLTDLTNRFLTDFIDCVDPRDYHDNREMFISMCLTPISMIASTIIDKAAVTMDIDRKEVFDQFIKKLELAMRWVDHKNK